MSPLPTPLVLPYKGRWQRTKPFFQGRGWGLGLMIVVHTTENCCKFAPKQRLYGQSGGIGSLGRSFAVRNTEGLP
jgi:hypothetical protein